MLSNHTFKATQQKSQLPKNGATELREDARNQISQGNDATAFSPDPVV